MPKKAPLVFIDTNVWFSAFYGSKNSEKILKAYIEGKIRAVICRKVLKELVRNIEAKVPGAFVPLKKFLELTSPVIIQDPSVIQTGVRTLVDKKDQVILQSAVSLKVKYFITGNLKDFNVGGIRKKYGIKVMSPGEAVRVLFD